MRIRWASMPLIASLVLPSAVAFGNEKAVANPDRGMEVSYDKREIKNDMENKAIYQQKMDETKAALDEAKKNLDQARAQNNPEVTKEAQQRVKNLQQEYNKLAKKSAKTDRQLMEDKRDLQEDRRENVQ